MPRISLKHERGPVWLDVADLMNALSGTFSQGLLKHFPVCIIHIIGTKLT